MVPSSLGCGSTVFAAMAILAPSAAALRAIARPIPREPPVMNRVLPFNDIGASVLRRSSRKHGLCADNAVAAFRNTAFEAARLNRKVLGKITCERGTTGPVSVAQRCKRFLGQHTAARRGREQAQIRGSAGEGRIGRGLCKQPSGRPFEAVD